MDDSAIIYDEVIKSYDEEIKTIPTNFNQKKLTYKTQSFYILLVILLITVALFIAAKRSSKKVIIILRHNIKAILYWYCKLKMSNNVKDLNIKNRTYYFF